MLASEGQPRAALWSGRSLCLGASGLRRWLGVGLLLALLLLTTAPAPTGAQSQSDSLMTSAADATPDPAPDTPSLTPAAPALTVAQQRTVLRLNQRLMCATCVGQTIADSQSRLAASMRLVVQQQVAAGRAEDDIVAYFVQRYGAAVRVDTPLAPQTLPLWLFAPLLALALLAALYWRQRRRQLPGAGSDA